MIAHKAPAASLNDRLGPVDIVSIARRRAAAPRSSMPVTPLPIAASVKATSTAASMTQTSASNRP